jgi:hypothetical protein
MRGNATLPPIDNNPVSHTSDQDSQEISMHV